MTLEGLVALVAAGALAAQDSSRRDTVRVDTVFTLSEVVITATRAAPSIRLEQPTAVSVIAPPAADRHLGRIAADLLRDLPGVHVQQTSAGQGAVVLRGLVGNQVLLMVDGIPLNNGTYRDGPGQYLATIDPDAIERVEVLRGPASVLYGSDAQGGVVNLITRPHPAGRRGLQLSSTASSANEGVRARVSGGLIGPRWQASFGGSAARAGDTRAGGGLGAQTPTSFSTFGLDGRLRFQPGAAHELIVAVQHFAMDDVHRFDRYVTFRAPAPGADVLHVFDPQVRQLAYLRHRYQPHGSAVYNLEVTASLAVQREGRRQRRLLNTGQADSLIESVRDDVYTPGVSLVGSSLAFVAQRLLKLEWGADLYHDRLNSWGRTESVLSGRVTDLTRVTAAGAIPSGRFPDGSTSTRLGAFVSAESEVVPHLRITAGARWSRFRNESDVGLAFGGRVVGTSSDLTGQLGVVTSLSDDWSLAFRVAEGFRAPNLYDLTNVGPVPGGVQLPNPSARPERSFSTEIGVRHVTPRRAIDVTLYRSSIRDFIDRTPGEFNGDTLFNGERVFQGRNVGTARQLGVEAEAVQRVGALEGRATLLYTFGEQELAAGGVEPMSKIPPLNGSVRLRWTATGRRLWIDYALRWAAAQRRLSSRDRRDTRIAPDGTPGYAVHGLRAAFTLGPALTLTGGVDNLTDTLYRNHGSGVDSPGRHVWVGLSWTGP